MIWALLGLAVVAALVIGFCVGQWRELQESKRSAARVAEVMQRANTRYVERIRELEGLLADRSRVEIGIPPRMLGAEDDVPKVKIHPAVIAEIEGLEDHEARDEFMMSAWQYYEAHPNASAGDVIAFLFPQSGRMIAEVEA